jgi:2,4-dienoyl-CoA reductase-like NADH-dependent reductase (Old Yellow Enzyme family)
MSDTLKLYQTPASPNSRRVRMFIAEKGIAVPLVAVDLGKARRDLVAIARAMLYDPRWPWHAAAELNAKVAVL